MTEGEGKILLRPSEINEYLKCSAKYMFNYVLRLPSAKSVALAFGSATHKALETNYKQKVDTHSDLPLGEVVQAFSDSFDVEKQDVERVDLIANPDAKDIGVALVQRYHQTVAPQIQPQEVEVKIKAEFEGYDFGITGTLDLITDLNNIHDHKTASKSSSEPPAAHIRQGSFYRLLAQALGIKINKVFFDYLVKTKSPKIYRLDINTEPEHALRLAQSVGSAVSKEVFIPNRESNFCSRRYCSYWHHCEKKFGGTVRS